MAWRPITDDDLQSAINSFEDEGFRTKLLAEGQTDPYAKIFGQVTVMFRDAIRSCARNILDPDPTTLPEGAIFHAVAIIRHRLITRFDIGEVTQARLDEHKAAEKYYAGLPSCSPLVEIPEGAGGETAKPPLASPAVNQSPRRDGWRNQDGI